MPEALKIRVYNAGQQEIFATECRGPVVLGRELKKPEGREDQEKLPRIDTAGRITLARYDELDVCASIFGLSRCPIAMPALLT